MSLYAGLTCLCGISFFLVKQVAAKTQPFSFVVLIVLRDIVDGKNPAQLGVPEKFLKLARKKIISGTSGGAGFFHQP